jgi:hypothetical protein
VTLAIATAAMRDRKTRAVEAAPRLGVVTTVLHVHISGDGPPKAAGTALLVQDGFYAIRASRGC